MNELAQPILLRNESCCVIIISEGFMKSSTAVRNQPRKRKRLQRPKFHVRKSETKSTVSPVPAEIDSLKTSLGSQSNLADLLGVDRSSVTRWVKGEDLPDPENEEKIIALRYVISRLTRIFKEEVAASWLQGINALLGNQRPIDLLRNGRVTEVMAAIEQTETGSYA